MRTDNLIALASSLRYQAVRYLQEALEKNGVTDLIPSHGALLASLYGRGGRASMKEIVVSSRRNKPTVTEMAKALERRGYLVREKDPDDGRGIVLTLTDKAMAIKPLFDSLSVSMLESAWGTMAQKDRETVCSLLMTVIDNMAQARNGVKED